MEILRSEKVKIAEILESYLGIYLYFNKQLKARFWEDHHKNILRIFKVTSSLIKFEIWGGHLNELHKLIVCLFTQQRFYSITELFLSHFSYIFLLQAIAWCALRYPWLGLKLTFTYPPVHYTQFNSTHRSGQQIGRGRRFFWMNNRWKK